MQKVLSSVKRKTNDEHPYNEMSDDKLQISLEKGDITLEVGSNNSPKGI